MKKWYDWKEMRRDVNTLCREIVLDKFVHNKKIYFRNTIRTDEKEI